MRLPIWENATESRCATAGDRRVASAEYLRHGDSPLTLTGLAASRILSVVLQREP